MSAFDVGWATPEGRQIFQGLTFHLGTEKTGLVGGNGVGKTTLARLLVGELTPTQGSLRRTGTLGWLPQSAASLPGTVAERLGIEKVLEAISAIEGGAVDDHLFETVGEGWDVEARARFWLEHLGLPELGRSELGFTEPMGTLSGGEAMRVALAGCLLKEPDLLVLDEPTNHLDAGARAALHGVLDQHKGGLLVISHDRALLRRMERTLELSSRGLRSYGGGFDHYREQLAIEDRAAKHRVETATKQLEGQRRAAQDAAERQARRGSSGKRAALRKGRSKLEIQGARRQAERTTGRLGAVHDERIESARGQLEEARALQRVQTQVRLDFGQTAVPAGRTVLEAEGLNVRFGDRWLWTRNVDVRLVGPMRLALQGANGSGKTTLARLLIGELEPHRGRLRLNETRVAWLDQRTQFLPDGRSLVEAMRLANPSLSTQEAYWGLDALGLGRAFASRLPETLSGGERMRATLACLFNSQEPPRLLVVDEPTNNLDLQTVEVLERALASYQGAMIVISHDQDFLDALGLQERLSF
ncbi:MAG: ABC-F family ATP-binding cassette domain-containing protein [Acidobacteriota bacterium]